MDMVWRTFLCFEAVDYTDEGIRNFWQFISDNRLYHSFLRGDYRVMVAMGGVKTVGMASLRDQNHLSLLFVDGAYHRKGIGRELMQSMFSYLCEEVGALKISLMAAPCAVGFYRKLGFEEICSQKDYAGIRVTSMEKHFLESLCRSATNPPDGR